MGAGEGEVPGTPRIPSGPWVIDFASLGVAEGSLASRKPLKWSFEGLMSTGCINSLCPKLLAFSLFFLLLGFKFIFYLKGRGR